MSGLTLLKIRATEIACGGTPNTFSNAFCVRLVETGTGNALVTQKLSGGTTVGTFTLRQGNEAYVVKAPTDTLESNAATVVGVNIAFQ